MTRSSVNYLVYSCSSCSKRIFTDRSHRGRTGTCPCCGDKHVVGGARIATAAEDRRGARRVSAGDSGAQVGLVSQDALLPLRDLSETGIAFMVRAADASEVGDVLEVTLQPPGAEAPRHFQAEVRRVETDSPSVGVCTVAAQFLRLDPSQRAVLKAIVNELTG